MSTIRIDVNNLESQAAALSFALNKQALLKGIGEIGLSWVNKNFEQEGRMVGVWVDLEANTIAGRRSGSRSILQDTGNLRESFDYEISGDMVRIGTKVEYASYHEFGTGPYDIYPVTAKALAFMTAGGMVFAKVVHHPGLPQRRMLPDERDMQEIAQTALDLLLQSVNLSAGSMTPQLSKGQGK